MKNLAARYPVAVFVVVATLAALSLAQVILVVALSIPLLVKVLAIAVFALIIVGALSLVRISISELRSRDE